MSTDDELRTLRERAYGPTADIHDDPVALARLRALEAAETEARIPVQIAEPASPVESASDPERGPDPETDPGPEPEPAPTGRLPRRTIWLWAASVAAALLLGAAITTATSAIVADRVAVLPETDLAEWPTNVFGDAQEGARIFEAYEGIRVLVVPNAWGSPSAEITCLFVVRADGADGSAASNEILTTGCAGEAFSPTASFTVTDASPADLRERFPVGTGVRVVVSGNEAQVFARAP